jgi:septum formation protein
VEETATGEGGTVALGNARRKARAIAQTHSGAVVIGCDTVVALDRRLLGKPSGEEEARQGLVALSGREHVVLSGLCVVRDGEELTRLTTTRVSFRSLDEARIDWYLATEEWRGRAGGYAIQDRGAALVDRIEGDYSSVVGLPLAALQDLVPDLLQWTGAESL